MAWTAPSTFVAGAILTAAQLNTNVRDNTLAGGPIYTNEAARDAAITSPFEGQRAYLTASTVAAATGTATAVPTGIQTIYNGSAWVCVTPVGANLGGTSQAMTTAFVNLTVGGTALSVTLSTGTTALVSFSGAISGNANYLMIGVKTALNAAADQFCAFCQTTAYLTVGKTYVATGLTAGTNTFTLQGKNDLAGGTAANMNLAVQGIA